MAFQEQIKSLFGSISRAVLRDFQNENKEQIKSMFEDFNTFFKRLSRAFQEQSKRLSEAFQGPV